MTEEKYTAQQLKEMADTLLAADKAQQQEKAVKTAKTAAADDTKPAEKADDKLPGASKGKLDDKTIATLPAAALLTANEKLKELFVKGKKKGRLDSGELSECWTKWIWTATRWTPSTTRWRRWVSRSAPRSFW